MGIYMVGANGKAPKGLSAGDQVVTGGGTYTIDIVNSDGTYSSKLTNSSQNTSNYKGVYDVLGNDDTEKTAYPSGSSSNSSADRSNSVFLGSVNNSSGSSSSAGASAAKDPTDAIISALNKSSASTSDSGSWAGSENAVTNYGDGQLLFDDSTGVITRVMPNGQRYYVNPGDNKYQSIYTEYQQRYGQSSTTETQEDELLRQYQDMLEQVTQSSYQPVDQQQYTDDIMSFDEAIKLSEQLLTPQYAEKYRTSADKAAQALERAGLYDSVYGQALAADAENSISEDLNAAIYALAVDLVGASREQALSLLKLAVDDNQYNAGYDLEKEQTGLDYYLKLIDTVIDQANAEKDFQLQLRAEELKQKIASAEISETEAATALKILQMEQLKSS